MTQVGRDTVVVEFVAEIGKAEKKLDQLRQKAKRTGKEMAAGGRGGAAAKRASQDAAAGNVAVAKSAATADARLKSLTTQFGTYERGFRRANTSVSTGNEKMDIYAMRLDRASMSMWKFTIAAIPLKQIAMMLGLVAAASGALTVKLAKQAAWLVVTKRQFANMTGSMQAANEEIDWLREQAPKIVDTVQDVIEAGRILRSGKFDPRELIYPLADLAAGLGQEGIGIVSATRAFVDGMHGEIRRLKNTFNITTQDITKFSTATTWITFQALDTAQRQSAIINAILEKYPDANKAALESILGAWSEFKDKLINTSIELGKHVIPVLEWVLDKVDKVMTVFENTGPLAKQAVAYGIMGIAALAALGSIVASVMVAKVMWAGYTTALRIWGQTGTAEAINMYKLQLLLAKAEADRFNAEMARAGAKVPMATKEVAAIEAITASELKRLGVIEAQTVAETTRAAASASGRGVSIMSGRLGTGGGPFGGINYQTGPRWAGPSWPGRRAPIPKDPSKLAAVGAFLSGNAAVIGAFAALAAITAVVIVAQKAREKKLRALADSTKDAADALQRLTAIVPEAERSLSESAEKMADAFDKATISSGLLPSGGGATLREFMGAPGDLTDAQIRALKDVATEMLKPWEERNPETRRYIQRDERAMAEAILRAQTGREMGAIEIDYSTQRRLQEMGLEVAAGMFDSKTVRDVAKTKGPELVRMAEEELKDLEGAPDPLGNLDEKIATLKAILKAEDRELQLARRITGEYQDQWDALNKTVDVTEGIEKANAEIADSSDVTESSVSKMVGRYNEAQAALAEMEDVNSKIGELSTAEAATRRRILDGLHEELRVYGELIQLAQALRDAAGRGRHRKRFEAAGGASFAAAGAGVADALMAARELRAAAAREQDEDVRDKLNEEAFDKEIEALEAQAEFRNGIKDLVERQAKLSDDEVENSTMLVQELGRQMALENAMHQVHMKHLRDSMAAEQALAAAEFSHNTIIAELQKKMRDESLKALDTIYDRRISILESERDLTGAIRDNAIEQARYEVRIAELKAQQARADADRFNDVEAVRGVMQAQYNLQKAMRDEEIAYADTRLALMKDMEEQGMATEMQVSNARRIAASEAFAEARKYGTETSRGLEAYRKGFNLMFDETDKKGKKWFDGIVEKIVGDPQNLMKKFASPTGFMSAFGGGVAGVRGPGMPERKQEFIHRHIVELKVDPQSFNVAARHISSETVARAFQQALPAFRAVGG